jgi:dTDP-4-amino-4,6-dideoxygalactose transaminase
MALQVAVDILITRTKLDETQIRVPICCPQVTFASCINVLAHAKCEFHPVDVDSETYLLKPIERKDLASLHFGCIAVRLGGQELPDNIYRCYERVIVDSAHSMAKHDARAFATCYSFHPSKIVSGIDGGVLVTNDYNVYMEARRLRNFGFAEGTRKGMGGYKGNMTNVSAVLISHNLDQLDDTLKKRKIIVDEYNRLLGLNWKGLGMYMVTVRNPDEVCKKIPAIRHYPQPLYEYANEESLWVTEHLISLPLHEFMHIDEVAPICAIIKDEIIKR